MRRPFLAAFVPVLLLAALVPSLPAVDAQDTATLAGQVCILPAYNKETGQGGCHGQGLPGATVRVRKAGVVGPVGEVNESTKTDEYGFYFLEGLQDGTYTLSVERAGFGPHESSIDVEGDARRDVSLSGTTVEIAGSVHDPDGNGLAGAEVAFFSRDADTSPRLVAGEKGSFATKLRAGSYNVEARHPGSATSSREMLIDGTQPIDITLKPLPPQTSKVTGTVTDQDGAPVPDATVEVYQCCGYAEPRPMPVDDGHGYAAPDSYPYHGGNNATRTDTEGRFTIFVDAGEVSLNVYKDGHTQFNEWFAIGEDQTVSKDIGLYKYPEKTARIEGKAVDAKTGKGLAFFSVSVQSPRFGIHECSVREGEASDPGYAEPMPAREAGMSIAPSPYPYPGCAITVRSDGTFEGTVTPGYAILNVHFEHWRTCKETRDADGSYRSECGQDLYPFVQTLVLKADATTKVEARLTPRPGPDAKISGYVVGTEDGVAVPGARIEFSNMDNHAYGYAVTDQDGSYAVKLRSGLHRVTVWADGHLHWEGQVVVPADGDVPLDVRVTPGREAYGGCCVMYAEARPDVAYADDTAVAGGGAKTAAAPPLPPEPEASGEVREGGEAASAEGAFQDLGGGLGPYDAGAREKQLAAYEEGKDTPLVPLALLVLALAALALVARRRA